LVEWLFDNSMKTIDSVKLAQKQRASVMLAARSLKSDLPVSRVILFGSMARGTGDAYSDIDLLVITSCPVTSRLRGNVSEKLADINLQNDVALSSIVVCEQDWLDGLIRYMPIYSEVQRDGCEV